MAILLVKCDFSCSCAAADKISTNLRARAVSLRQLSYLSWFCSAFYSLWPLIIKFLAFLLDAVYLMHIYMYCFLSLLQCLLDYRPFSTDIIGYWMFIMVCTIGCIKGARHYAGTEEARVQKAEAQTGNDCCATCHNSSSACPLSELRPHRNSTASWQAAEFWWWAVGKLNVV